MHFAIIISSFIIIFFLSAYLTQRIWQYTISRSILDIPNERSSHTDPIPRGGGLAIVVITLSGLMLARIFRIFIYPWPMLLAYLSGALQIAIISWLDDFYTLPSSIRFCIHCTAALTVVLGFGFWNSIEFPIMGRIDLGSIGKLITFIWIIGLTNSYNFMDGIDGIAGGQALVAGLGWIFFGLFMNVPLLTIMGVLLAASSFGFLRYNWSPAHIFMGDVGSAFLGYSFACLAIGGSLKSPFLNLIGILLVWPFIFDTGFTFLRRVKNRENIFAAHRSHLYQRLVICGYTHQAVTILYMGLAVFGILLSILIMKEELWAYMMLLTLLPFACLCLWGFTVLQEKKVSLIA